MEELVFSLARELMTNVARHSAASSARLRLRACNGLATLEVQDDGIGLAPGRLAAAVDDGHFGLRAARERVQSAGGSLFVASSPRGGTSVRVQLPLREPGDRASRTAPSAELHEEMVVSNRERWRAGRDRLRVARAVKPL
jgi:two-component system NarL family sensor kinase